MGRKKGEGRGVSPPVPLCCCYGQRVSMRCSQVFDEGQAQVVADSTGGTGPGKEERGRRRGKARGDVNVQKE